MRIAYATVTDAISVGVKNPASMPAIRITGATMPGTPA
jgi:hypothetical protein